MPFTQLPFGILHLFFTLSTCPLVNCPSTTCPVKYYSVESCPSAKCHLARCDGAMMMLKGGGALVLDEGRHLVDDGGGPFAQLNPDSVCACVCVCVRVSVSACVGVGVRE